MSADAKAAQGAGWAARAFHTLHHLLAAALMASAMLVLEKAGWMDWLDAAMLNIVGIEAPAAALPPRELPQLVLIDAPTYAGTFGARSPLDREVLARLFGELLSAQPAALLVDLQLEPLPGEPATRALDELLATAARPMGEGAGVQITLPLPAVRTPALDARALQWMRGMCEAGIRFGSAELRSHLGSVVRLDLDPLALGQVARGAAPAAAGHGHAADSEAAGERASLCDLATRGATLEVMWQMLGETAAHLPSAPLSPGLVKQLDAEQLAWRPGQTGPQIPPGARIVVGGAYDGQDRFATPAKTEPVPGVLLHASALANPGRDTGHARAWAADVVLGTVLGFVFLSLWKRVGKGRALREDWSWRDVLRSWLLPLRALLPWLVAAIVAWLLMKAAGWLMAEGLWLNPGPMVLGMLLHALLLKDSGPEHNIETWHDFTRHHPTWSLQLGLILLGLGIGLAGHH